MLSRVSKLQRMAPHHPAGSHLQSVVNIRAPSCKTNTPWARQHDDLGLLHPFRGKIFDDLTDDQGSHESVLSWEEHKQNLLEAPGQMEIWIINDKSSYSDFRLHLCLFPWLVEAFGEEPEPSWCRSIRHWNSTGRNCRDRCLDYCVNQENKRTSSVI